MTGNWMETSAGVGEEEEQFYESLDRILSSSCSSTSASDDEADPRHHHHQRGGGGVGAPRRGSARHRHHSLSDMYDVWIGEPGSVEERRRRLLQKLGLIGDPALARRRGVAGDEEEGEETRRSVVVPSNEQVAPVPAGITRSRSDGSVRGDAGEALCTIRNLDNGEEFVVKEVREDGMWKELREVGTGRQLTMEEFQISVVGHSPIVEELMRRQGGEEPGSPGGRKEAGGDGEGFFARLRRKGTWFRSIRGVAGGVGGERRSSDWWDTSLEKGGRMSSSATDDSQDVHSSHHHGPERVRVRQYGKGWKELSGLWMNQEIQAHCGAIWSIKFSLDGRYLASAGEDCVIHVWQVVELERKRGLEGDDGVGLLVEKGENPEMPVSNASPPCSAGKAGLERESSEKRWRLKVPGSRKSFSSDAIVIPNYTFALSEKPVCSFFGHSKGVLDLSWSKSEHLLSSSMDKTVKLWDMSSNSCLKTFLHSHYVTCIQFNPVDDNYFISGSLDAKVRLWSIEERQVVDWTDLHEMVTAVCYTPDGQGALVGSDTGSCNFYNTSGHKLHEKCPINLQNNKKKPQCKKITGFQFAPGQSSEVFVTSADSRIRIVDGVDLVHKFKGFRNRRSQISASITADGKHVVCASKDSRVYIWRYDADSRPSRSKGITETQSYEYFHCSDVSVTVTWPGTNACGMQRTNSSTHNIEDSVAMNPRSPLPVCQCSVSPRNANSTPSSNIFSDRVSATWPEEKLLFPDHVQSPRSSCELKNEALNRSACGMVIVTANCVGEIKAFQNFGNPVRL